MRLPVKSLDGESIAKVCHVREEAAFVCAIKILKPNPFYSDRRRARGENWLLEGCIPTLTLTLPASFGFGTLFSEMEVSCDSTRSITSSKYPLHTSCRHFGQINQLRYFPPFSDFNYQHWEHKHTDTWSGGYFYKLLISKILSLNPKLKYTSGIQLLSWSRFHLN